MVEPPAEHWGEPHPLHDPWVLANFEPRPTDVLITTGPKAGTTWMQQILHQCRTGGDTGFDAIDDVVPWLEITRPGRTWRDILDDYEAIEDPRVFKTHCTYEQTPGTDTARIILTSRDPRACCISFYHHVMNMTDAAKAELEMDHMTDLDSVFESWLDFGSWYRNISSWWPHFEDDNVLWLRYEDLRESLPPAIDKILGFLGWTLSDIERERVLEYCSFDWMKANNHRFSPQTSADRQLFKPDSFIRKGQTGSYRETLSEAQEAMIMDKARETLDADCLTFLDLD